jgi:hypothetical protein
MSLCHRVATYFQQHPDEWIDGRTLAQIGGYAAWRTRLSELRRAPYLMTIENRVSTVRKHDTNCPRSDWMGRPDKGVCCICGKKAIYKVSSYRYVTTKAQESAA